MSEHRPNPPLPSPDYSLWVAYSLIPGAVIGAAIGAWASDGGRRGPVPSEWMGATYGLLVGSFLSGACGLVMALVHKVWHKGTWK